MKHYNRSACFNDISNRPVFDENWSFTSISTKLENQKHENYLGTCSEVQDSGNITAHFELISNHTKRSRDSSYSSEGKRSLGFHAPITKMITELYDSETLSTVAFRCFHEKDVIGAQAAGFGIIQNDCDDDCPTDNLQIDTCTDLLLKELEATLINFRN